MASKKKVIVDMEFDCDCHAPRCEGCGETNRQELEFAPCPFASEISGINDDVWLCHDCRYERAMDV